MAELRIGTCSWKFPSWEGLVYSARDGIDYLREYAQIYDTVEVDQWFWSLFGQDTVSLPRQEDARAYRAAVAADFRFTVKVANSITLTHLYRRDKGEPLVPNPHFLSPPLFRAFLSPLEPLSDVLGPLMFQFEYLNRQKMASQDEFQRQFGAFACQLPSGSSPGGYSYAVEVRNPGYMNPAYFEFLEENGLSPVLLQGYWMPPLTQVYERWLSCDSQQKVAVIRLLGPEREGIERQTGKRWNQIVAPKEEELEAIAQVVQDLLGRGVDVYLNVNNHYEGSAPLTIERIRRVLAGEPLDEVYVQGQLGLGAEEG
jgi:uncharacterized protein YecE (DUF72 family)